MEETISDLLEPYLDINPDGYSELNKQKYENNVDKDYPGLRKMVDTLSNYYEVIKYKKNYDVPNINFNIDEMYNESDSETESEDNYYDSDYDS